MTTVRIGIQRLGHARNLPLPSYASAEAAGLDLLAAVEADTVLGPGERLLVPTGIAIQLPVGFEAQVRPRSGLALKYGVTLLNSPGTIDSDYRGEVGVILINHGRDPFTIRRGDRIAQMVVAEHSKVDLVVTESLERSDRGAGGFGSTGVETATDRAAALEATAGGEPC